jgi:hypothetical protein
MFTKKDIKLMAEAERMMDDGAPFVMLGQNRVMCRQACMDEFGLRKGQTINGIIFREILKWNIEECQSEIDEHKLSEPQK